MRHLLIVVLSLPVLLSSCTKAYPPAGQMSAEMENGIEHGNVTTVKRLLDYRMANPNDLNGIGQSGLTLAVIREDLPMVQVLVEAGADVNYVRESFGEPYAYSNPLFQAALRDNKQIYLYLKQHGAKPFSEKAAGFIEDKFSTTRKVVHVELHETYRCIQEHCVVIDNPISASWANAKPMYKACADMSFNNPASNCSRMGYDEMLDRLVVDNWIVDKQMKAERMEPIDVVKQIRAKVGTSFAECSGRQIYSNCGSS